MAAPVRTRIDLSQLETRPVLRLVPPLPEVDEPKKQQARPRKARRVETKTRRVAGRRPSHSRVVPCSPAVRRRRRVAASILVGAGMFLAVLGVGAMANAFTANTVPDQTAVVWVQPGETLWDVAERSAPGYNPEAVVARIHELNEIPGNIVLAGQALEVPSAS
ncbi:LysM peptidoglycan-binding domain-containing protein [Kibdelosporangium philippinense]|uniref:LysM peptidoglycan-binding domain-containing protein n=1 Tax=Kibdelosporangium philippinense TaxID=211113 RepID=A0ABS8ZSV8_9PSEU|nr:LysM domain-containing protein [Kibdelosporangium philippinense]MCE7009528.1 LysM peptidoglycan-binding domain-containing protein [Kibdelosporangium philippinense]